jgi:hypothetical protein
MGAIMDIERGFFRLWFHGRSLNVRRGMIRLWVATSLLWIAVAGAFAYMQVSGDLKKSYFQYEQQSKNHEKPWDTDWSKPFYERNFAPGKGDVPDRFPTLDASHVDEWKKSPHLTEISFPDGSILFVPLELTRDDMKLLAKEFWDGRIERWIELAKPWATFVLVPPVALLIIGWIIGWVVRGFAPAF